jgi:PAS domain S-box-containing protein
VSSRALEIGHAEAIISSSEDAILSKDREGVVTSWNPGAERLYGYSAEEAIGRPISFIIPSWRAGEERTILARILAGERVERYVTERVRADDEVVIVSLTISPVRDADGEITGAAVIARNVTEQERARQRAASLQRLTGALTEELSVERAAAIVLDEAVPALGADAGTIGMLGDDGRTVTLVEPRGYAEDALEPWQEFRLDADVPMADAIRNGEAIWSSDPQVMRARYPGLGQGEPEFSALVIVPLTVESWGFGAIALSFHAPREFSEEERGFLLVASQQAANALARARLHESEQRTTERLAFLAEAGEVLSGSLELEPTLQRLAAIVVPELADWCSVHLAEDGGLRVVAVAHSDPAMVEHAYELNERYPVDPEAPIGVPNVIRTGEPELHAQITDEMLVEGARDEEHLNLLRELGFGSAIVVPLRAQDRILGAITLVCEASRPPFGAADLALAVDLARRAALAVDNAARYREQREAALTLQRALLPQSLPEIEGVEVAARYLPAGPGVEAGGDWYDVIALGDGEVAVVIGDVSGRGIPAASIMGRLRTAIRAYALDGHSPAAALTRLHYLMEDFEEPEMATIFHLVVAPGTGRGRYVRAGHPPALIRAADGTVADVEGSGSPPVGLVHEPVYVENRLEVAAGSTVLLFTDGLVERRTDGIDPGLADLRSALATAPADPDGCVDHVLEALGPPTESDDIAVVAVRIGA